MKKALIALVFFATGAFSVSAQFQVGDTRINVGRVCTTINGKPACVDPSTGQFQIVTGNGTGISGNTNTGQIGGVGTIGGVRVGGLFGGGSNGNGSGGAYGLGGVNMSGCLQGWLVVCQIIGMLQVIAQRAVPLLIGVALLAFFWFLIEFIWKGREDPGHYAKAKAGMMWSIIALFVMVSVWGIIGVMGSILGIPIGGGMHGFVLPGQEK